MENSNKGGIRIVSVPALVPTFTPGPWLPVSDSSGNDWEIWYTEPDGRTSWLADCIGGRQDAHLIAASPELFHALLKTQKCLQGMVLGRIDKDDAIKQIEESNTVIFKAMGFLPQKET